MTQEQRYPVRFTVLAKYFGQLSLVVGALTLAPLGAALYFREYSAGRRYGIMVGGLTIAAILAKVRAPARIQPNEGMVLVALIFLFAPLMMTYPLMESGLNFTDALFEAVSGITTTGLTTVAAIEEAPAGFLFARSWMQWYGGLGIVVLSLALVIEPGPAAKGLAANESESDDLIGGLRAHARRILIVYALLTVFGVILLTVLGARLFHAIVYTFAATSTGGFSPHNGSLAGLDAPSARAAVIFVCFLGSIPLVFYPGLYEKKRRFDVNALQASALLISGICFSLLFTLSVSLKQGWTWEVALQHAPLMAFSAQTTAGFSTMPVSDLSAVSKALLILAMAIGGGIGSTAGGFKILRLLIFLHVLRLIVLRTGMTRHTVVEPRLANHRLQENEIRNALALMMLFFLVVVLSWLPFMAMGYDPMNSLFEVVSAIGTVGLSAGITSSELPSILKAILCLNMLMGRLEILAWLVLLYPGTWIGRKMEEV